MARVIDLGRGASLLPCPMCGGAAQVECGGFLVAVTCPCSSHVFYGAEHSIRKTVAAWNRRAGREADDGEDK